MSHNHPMPLSTSSSPESNCPPHQDRIASHGLGCSVPESENFFWNSFQKEVSFRRTHILAKVYKCALLLKLQRSVYSNGSSSSSGTLINPSFSSLESVSDAFLLSAKKCSSTTTLLLYLFTPSLSV